MPHFVLAFALLKISLPHKINSEKFEGIIMADIRIKGRMVNAIRINLDTNDHDAIRQQLSPMLQKAFPIGTLAVIESSVEQELIELIQLLISLDLQPIAVTDGVLADQARAIQFPVIPPDRKMEQVKPTKEQAVEVPAVAEKPEPEEPAPLSGAGFWCRPLPQGAGYHGDSGGHSALPAGERPLHPLVHRPAGGGLRGGDPHLPERHRCPRHAGSRGHRLGRGDRFWRYHDRRACRLGVGGGGLCAVPGHVPARAARGLWAQISCDLGGPVDCSAQRYGEKRFYDVL